MSKISTHELLTFISLVGFDVRRSPKSVENQVMGPDRRSACLLLPQCPTVLSADRSLWPSIFFNKNEYQYVGIKFPDDILIPQSASNSYFEAFNLWDEPYAMREAFTITSTGDCGVAFGLVKPEYYKNDFISDSWFEAIYCDSGVSPPPKAGTDWTFLGFDVVNSGFESAISGFRLQENMDTFRKTWAASMNEFCLFDSLDQSLLFCKYANTNMAEDGPFFSLAIFLLWDTTGELKTKSKRIIDR